MIRSGLPGSPSPAEAKAATLVQSMESLAWALLLPAAAECTASVWFPEVALRGVDVQLAALNLFGAFLEGVFFEVEASPDAFRRAGLLGAVLATVAADTRSFFLSALTSWAGMVENKE